jgi:cell division protein FtsL
MTDAQMVTLCVAMLAVFAGTLFNNSRISDVNRHIDDKFALLSQQMKSMDDNILRLSAITKLDFRS